MLYGASQLCANVTVTVCDCGFLVKLLDYPIFRFALVGGFNTLLTYGIYLLFLHLGFHYQIALFFEYSVGICIGYILNRHWTFAVQEKEVSGFVRYTMTYVGVYLGNVVLLTIVVEMGWMKPALGQIVVLGFVSLVNFFIQKYWVFAKKENGNTPVS